MRWPRRAADEYPGFFRFVRYRGSTQYQWVWIRPAQSQADIWEHSK